MATNIVERSDLPSLTSLARRSLARRRLISDDDQAFACNRGQEKVSRLFQLALMPDQNPLLRENLFLFRGENFRRNKILLRKRLRAGNKRFRGLTKRRPRFLTRARAQNRTFNRRLSRFPQIEKYESA